MSDINDNKKFWNNVKPIFGNKNKVNKTIALEEGNEAITDDGKLAQTFNEYFVNIVPSLGITSFHENNDNISNDNIDDIIIKFEGHESVIAIKKQMKKYNKTFTFQNVTTDKVASIIKKLNSKKASKSDDVPTTVIKEFETFFAEFLSKNFNSCLETGSFSEDLKCAEVVPIYKNYRPISLLSNISKVYERCMQEQLDEYFSDLLSKYQCGFRQGYGTQNCPLAVMEKLRKIRDKKGIFAAVLTDLSKAFDCIPHNLLIAKVSAYGFDRKSLMFISTYLESRKQRTRIGLAFSDYLNMLFGVPQGSILGPILFIIFLSDLFYIYNDLDYANYADDTTLYVCRQNYAEAIEFLETTINNIFAWFKKDGLVANSGKVIFWLVRM